MVCLSASVIGCSPSDDSGGTAPVVSGSGVRHPFNGEALPLEAVLVLSADARGGLDAAVGALTESYMRERGLAYVPYPLKPEWSFLSPSLRYGSLSVDDAAESGYATTYPPTFREFDRAVEAVDRQRLAINPGYNEVMYGDGSIDNVGCYAEAQIQIYGTPGGLFNMDEYRAVIDIQALSSSRLYSDPLAEAAVRDWSGCMQRAGYRFTTWQDARSKYPRPSDDLTPSSDEAAQAVADANCRSEAKLESRLFELEDEIMQSLIDENAAAVTALTNAVAEASAHAETVLDRSTAES